MFIPQHICPCGISSTPAPGTRMAGFPFRAAATLAQRLTGRMKGFVAFNHWPFQVPRSEVPTTLI